MNERRRDRAAARRNEVAAVERAGIMHHARWQ